VNRSWAHERGIAARRGVLAFRCDEELAMHVRAALRNGLTSLREVPLQRAISCRVPAAAASSIARSVLDAA